LKYQIEKVKNNVLALFLLVLPSKYKQVVSEGTNIVEYQISPKTRKILHQIIKQALRGTSDFRTIGLIFNMIIYSKSTKVLEIGTSIGLSGLIILDAISKSGGKGKKFFVTVDPNHERQTKAENFFKKAGFDGNFKLVNHPSESLETSKILEKEAPFDVIYIDSLHQYRQIKKELEIYFKMLRKGGLLFCHDSSELASSFDKSNEGGVRRALKEFIDKNPIQSIFLDRDGPGWNRVGLFMGVKK